MRIKWLWPVLGLLCILLSGAFAQNTAVGNVNTVLLKATGPYEDMVHYILTRNDPKVATSLAAADAYAAEVVKLLPATSAREFEGLRQEIHAGLGSKDGKRAAASSAAAFLLLVDRLEASTLVVPKEVELLDYAGYKLSLLASFRDPDWKAIGKLTSESQAWWSATSARVSDKHLRATMTSAIKGIKQATEQKNGSMLQLGAQMVLDLVDMLEDGFKAAKASAAVK